MANGHGGARVGAGRPSTSAIQLRDVTENVLALVHQVDADAERFARSVRMLRAYAVAVAGDPGAERTWDELQREAALAGQVARAA